MTENQFNRVTIWQRKVFGSATSLSKISHLTEELQELVTEIKAGNSEETQLEFADCFLLLFGAASAWGLSYQQICDCIDKKMAINEKRKWGTPDENGVVRHINPRKG